MERSTKITLYKQDLVMMSNVSLLKCSMICNLSLDTFIKMPADYLLPSYPHSCLIDIPVNYKTWYGVLYICTIILLWYLSLVT